MSEPTKCPYCASIEEGRSGFRIFYICGSYSTGPTNTHTSSLCDARRELTETQEYARKLSLKITDLCAERDRFKARVAELEGRMKS